MVRDNFRAAVQVNKAAVYDTVGGRIIHMTFQGKQLAQLLQRWMLYIVERTNRDWRP